MISYITYEMYTQSDSLLQKRLPYIEPEVISAVRNEMAKTFKEFNSCRSRALFMDAKASEKMAPKVVRLMAEEYEHDASWIEDQHEFYSKLAQTH